MASFVFKRSALGLLSIMIASSCFLQACTQSGVSSTPAASSVYDNVMKKGKIRCGYVIYEPGCMKDPNTGKLSGIGIDTIEMAAKNLGLEVEWGEEVGWGTMLEGLETKRYDMVATPIWTNSTRARLVDFGSPIYYSPIFAYAKAGNTKLKVGDLSKLNLPTTRIATVDGETAEVIAKEDFPEAKKVSVPQLSDVAQDFLAVDSGKADITFAEPALAATYAKNNPGKLINISGDVPVRIFPNCWMFRRGQMEFKNMLDTALSQLINSGAVEKIIAKYEPAPNTLYRVALPYKLPHASTK